jgi:hypothetical protein
MEKMKRDGLPRWQGRAGREKRAPGIHSYRIAGGDSYDSHPGRPPSSALNSAREVARAILCKGTVSQFSKTMAMYEMDNGNWLPALNSVGIYANQNWLSQVRVYLPAPAAEGASTEEASSARTRNSPSTRRTRARPTKAAATYSTSTASTGKAIQATTRRTTGPSKASPSRGRPPKSSSATPPTGSPPTTTPHIRASTEPMASSGPRPSTT